MATILKNVRFSKKHEYEIVACDDGISGFANRTFKSRKVFVTLEF